jgi:hypothetical protein
MNSIKGFVHCAERYKINREFRTAPIPTAVDTHRKRKLRYDSITENVS